MITKEAWLEAADVLDCAHDVLLSTGVQCGETYVDGQLSTHDPDAEANCTWEAIAIALGKYNHFNQPDWRKTVQVCHPYRPDIDPVAAAIGTVMRGFSPEENDRATVDEVFDQVRIAAKICRENADGADS